MAAAARVWMRIARAAPFAIVAALSLWVAARAAHGRHATVVGHHARLADLAPNLVSAVVCLGFVVVIRRMRWRQ